MFRFVDIISCANVGRKKVYTNCFRMETKTKWQRDRSFCNIDFFCFLKAKLIACLSNMKFPEQRMCLK